MEEEGRKRRLEDKDKIGNATFLKNHEVFPQQSIIFPNSCNSTTKKSTVIIRKLWKRKTTFMRSPTWFKRQRVERHRVKRQTVKNAAKG